MNTPPKAIETQYNGYRFRSRLEARWAIFFDALGIRWEYEKEGYELQSGWYLPDFWLPDDRLWVEIKGEMPTDAELKLAKELAESTRFSTFVFHANPTSAKCHGFVFVPWSDDTFILREWDDVVIWRDYNEIYPRPHFVVFISPSFIDE